MYTEGKMFVGYLIGYIHDVPIDHHVDESYIQLCIQSSHDDVMLGWLLFFAQT